MSDTNLQSTTRPVFKIDDNGVHNDVWRKVGQYGPFYEIERYKPYRDKQTGEWKKSHMLSDRDLLVSQKLESKVLKEIERFKQLDKEVAARNKSEHLDQHPQQSQQSQPSQSQPQNMDHADMQKAQQDAFNVVPPQQQAEQAHDRPHEPSR